MKLIRRIKLLTKTDWFCIAVLIIVVILFLYISEKI